MTAPKTIMLVDDEEGHAVLLIKQLRRQGVQNPIRHFMTGSSALAWLDAPDHSAETLQLIVLDINLSDMSGTEILAQISTRPDTKTIPVIMLTSSDDPADAQLCFALGCRQYMIKPMQAGSFVDVCSDLGCPLSIEPAFAADRET